MVPPSVYLLFVVVAGIFLAYLQAPIFAVLLLFLGVILIRPSVRVVLIVIIGLLAFFRATPLFPGELSFPQKEDEYLIKIIELEKTDDGYQSIVSLWLNNKKQPEFNHKYKVATFISDQTLNKSGISLKTGSYYQLRGAFRALRPQLNFYGFNEKSYYLRQGVVGYVKTRGLEESTLNVKEPFFDILTLYLTNLFTGIREYSLGLLDGLPAYAADYAKGVLLGERPVEDSSRIYKLTGTYHLLVVSGLHFALLFSFLYTLGVPRLIILLVLGFYLLLVGLSPSSLRAFVMIVLPLMLLPGKLPKSRDFSLSLLLTSAWLVLLFLPYSLFSLSYYLSFGATLGILMFSPSLKTVPWLKHFPTFIREGLSASLSANLVILPLLLYYFLEFPLYFLPANLWGTSITAIFLPLGFIYLLLHLITPLEIILRYLLVGFAFLLHRGFSLLGLLPGASQLIPYPLQLSLWLSVALFLLIYFYPYIIKLLPAIPRTNKQIYTKTISRLTEIFPPLARIKRIYLALLSTLIFFVVLLQLLTPSGFELVFLYAGQGNGAVLRTPSGRVYLLDAGTTDADSNNYLKLLAAAGKTCFDTLVITHPHSDHYLAATSLLRDNKINRVITLAASWEESREDGFKDLWSIPNRKPQLFKLEQTGIIQDGQVSIEIITPPFINGEDLNSHSLVIKISYQGFEFLLTGDAPLSNLQGLEEEYEVLKVPHHGGKNSLNLELLKRLNPRFLVISCGKDNPFGHPLPQTLKVIEEYNKSNLATKTYITSDHGAIAFRINNHRLKISSMVKDEW